MGEQQERGAGRKEGLQQVLLHEGMLQLCKGVMPALPRGYPHQLEPELPPPQPLGVLVLLGQRRLPQRPRRRAGGARVQGPRRTGRRLGGHLGHLRHLREGAGTPR